MNSRQECNRNREDLVTLVLGELNAAAERDIARHVELCPECRRFRDALDAEERMLRSAVERMAPVIEPLRARLARQATLSRSRRIKARYKLLSAAASIAILAAAAWLLSPGDGNGAAFAAVARQLSELTFSAVIETTRPVLATGRMKTTVRRVYRDRNRNRVETSGEDGLLELVMIDVGRTRYSLNPSTRKYKQVSIRADIAPAAVLPRLSARLNALAESNAERSLGESFLDGRRVRSYTAESQSGSVKVWIDAATHRLVRLQMQMTQKLQQGPVTTTVVYHGIRWDEPLDDALFVVPGDYKAYVRPALFDQDDELGLRRLKDGVTLTLTRFGQDEIATEADVEWAALREHGDELHLAAWLNDRTWAQVSRSAPWNYDFNGKLRSVAALDHLTVDHEHGLILVDVTSLRSVVSEWLTPVESVHRVAPRPR